MEKLIKQKLIERGFKEETLLNNRGLIGACIEETEQQLRLYGVVWRSEQLNDEEIPNIDDWIKDQGYTQITFSCVYKKAGTYKDKEELFKEYRKEFCL